jgi:arginine/serine-rich splicing factor 1/9
MYPETGNNDAKVYVGNLPSDTRLRDLEDIFYKFGKIRDIDLHSNRNPPFAFVEFEDVRDAEDAVYARDGYDFDGYKIRVEFPRSSNRGRSGPPRGRGGGGRGGSRPFVRRGAKGYKCVVTGLPPTGSWQDLKDHFRECGDVIFTDVTRDGTGIVEFSRHDHMKRAVRDLHDSKFRSHEVRKDLTWYLSQFDVLHCCPSTHDVIYVLFM